MARIFVNLLHITGKKGGMEIYDRELYRAIGELDHAHEFVAWASTEFARSDHSWFPGRVIDSGLSGENRFAWAWGELVGSARAARAERADLFHGAAMFAPLRPPCPVVVTMHDMLYFTNPELMSTPAYTSPVKWMEKLAARRAARMLTISEVSRRDIVHYLGYPQDKIDVIPLAGTRAARQRTGQRETDHLLAVGQRRPHKNFENLLRGLASIPADSRPRLTITGSYGDDPLRPIVVGLGLSDWVTLEEWIPRERLEELFARATALVDASLVTGFSLPTLEAMLDGLPVALADTEVFREVGGDAALYFDPRDPDAIGAAMLALTSDAGLRATLTDRGRRRAAEFSWSKVARATLDSFDRVLAGD